MQTILFVEMPSQANVRATRSRSLAESEHVQAKGRRDGQDCKVTCRNKVLRNDETEQMNRKNGGKNSQLQDKERSDSTGTIRKRTTSALPEKRQRVNCCVRKNECGLGGRGKGKPEHGVSNVLFCAEYVTSLSRLDKCLAGYVDDDIGRRGYRIHG